MKAIENKKLSFDVESLELDVEKEIFVNLKSPAKLTYAELLIQLVKVPAGAEGLGDLEEQHARLSVIDKAKKAKKTIELEKDEIAVLQKSLPFYGKRLQLLSTELVTFQKEIKEL